MKRHNSDRYHVVGEGILTYAEKGKTACVRPSATEELTSFRFSRLGEKGTGLGESVRIKLAEAMTAGDGQPDNPGLPAGFTYLGQFVDHDLTMDATKNIKLGDAVTVEQLVQGRSPALDLDSLYGFGPVVSPEFYTDGIRLRTGHTDPAPVTGAPPTALSHPGADLPRAGVGTTKQDRRKPLIPDPRNDENLAVAQTHAAFIRFHNRVVDTLAAAGTPSADLFSRARETVVKHYQWMLRHDFLPRIVDSAVLDDVFTNGRRFFEVPAAYDASHLDTNSYMCVKSGDAATIPVEFTVAAYRLGHSMIRDAYQWNVVFRQGGLIPVAGTLELLFRFTGTSGNLAPGGGLDAPEDGNERLPSNWIADFRRLYDFREADRPDLVAPDGNGGVELNATKRLDTRLVDPLRTLPLGSFDGRDKVPEPTGPDLNLAFRNLTRAEMVELATGAQMAGQLGVPALTPDQILTGDGTGSGADLSGLSPEERTAVAENPPLWFYVLREAELNDGKLTGVGARIVAEVFHRAIEGSHISIVRDPAWTPHLGPQPGRFRMTDLLLEAFEGRADLLNPLGDPV